MSESVHVRGRSCSPEEWTDTLIVCQSYSHYEATAPLNNVVSVRIAGSREEAWMDLETGELGSEGSDVQRAITAVDCGLDGCFAKEVELQIVTIQGVGFGWGTSNADIMFRGRPCEPRRWTDTTIECEGNTDVLPWNNYVYVSGPLLYSVWDLVKGTEDASAQWRANIVSVECGGASCTSLTGPQDVTIKVRWIALCLRSGFHDIVSCQK